ncbi:flagellar basal body rod protein FlgB [Acidomonas methanolica]|uniref:flagellar basal body rod protein FlgB n=1 Tax=Acidomonas methanolica TaxID=437 RepID=UPI00211A3E18|nr:flagellar basal body protein [Acidomonas methanolica]MCQ9154010.1 flagellar biosynthesis protein FlgB [Acidomonas methanolica]
MLNADRIALETGGQGTNLLALGARRLSWLSARQEVLAGNVANADTPDFAPKDVTPFQAAVDEFDVEPVRTNEAHFGVSADRVQVTARPASERSLDGNQVSLEHELEQVADVQDQQHLATNLYTKYMSMFQTVLDK